MKFKKGNILKSKKNNLFKYKVLDIIVWNNVQIMKLEPIDVKESFRNGTYENLIAVNDDIKDIFKLDTYDASYTSKENKK